MKVSMAKRHEYWNHFVAQWAIGPKRPGITGARLRKIMPQIMDDDTFWQDVVLRHGGDKMTPEEMAVTSPYQYYHSMGNFWGMIRQNLVAKRLVK